MLPHHLIGTQAFLPSLLSYIRSVAAPASLPLDHVIFQSILLCLIAGDKHLILRTPEEDIPLVVRLAVWTLSSIFNLPTHKLRIRSRLSTNATACLDASAFLRSLFFSSGSTSNQTSQDEAFTETSGLKNVNHHRQVAHSRPSKHKKFRSFPNNLAAAVQTHGSTNVTGPLLMSGSVPIPDFIPSTFTASVPIIRPHPIYPNEPIWFLPHSHSDPLPVRRKRPSQSKLPLQLPHALVISGLEYATDLTQRTFANVLTERQVILESRQNRAPEGANNRESDTDDDHGTWNLPDGFITVYVCPLNARERPSIHKTLLDKFAMSTNIYIAQQIRHDFSALPFTPNPRPFHPHFPSHSNPGTPSPSYPTSLPQSFTPPTFTKPLPLHSRSSSHFNPPPLPEDIVPPSFLKVLSDAYHRTHISHTLSIYLADIFSATRHNSHLDATLLTVRASKDADALIRASRVIGADLSGMELLRPVAQADDFSDAGSQKMAGYQKPANNSSKADEGSESFHSAFDNTLVLDVSEVDVARIAPRVISHRVRIRDGPEDEILSSALFGATFKPPILRVPTGTDVPAGQLTVKGVLVQILSEV